MKKTNFFSILTTIFTMFFISTFAYADITMATGGKGGFYYNGAFSTLNSCLKRVSDGDYELEQAVEKGTDGTIHNIKLVESGKADIGIVQMGGLVLEDPDVEVIGVIMYELTHLVAPKNSRVDEFSDLEDKGRSVGFNIRSGSNVTFSVFKKEDKDYAKATIVDVQRATKGINQMTQGKLDSMFFVSAPRTKNIKRMIASGMEFLDFDDGDFDDFEYNGKPLYSFVKVGKKDGYPNTFKALVIPAVIIANKNFIEENEELYDYLFDAVNMAKVAIKGQRKFTYYPDN